jgi:uncharacterized protein YeaC (DUF1315 family)
MKYPVNTPEFRLVRGMQNEVAFCVRNVDRKPVALPGSDVLTIYVVDITSNKLLMQRDLLPTDVARGIYQLIVTAHEIDTWPTGPMRWSLVRARSDANVMLWLDQDYTPHGVLFVDPSPLPGPYVG